MYKYQVSVIVLTYNSEKKVLERTLNSIINQKNIDFEIIVADDGSKYNNKEFLLDYFKNHNFENFQLVLNEKNHGTVKNLISALDVSNAEYVKDISPGDYLYDENTLSIFYNKLKNSNYNYAFGIPIYYNYDNDDLRFFNWESPRDLSCYKKKNKNIILKNYLYNQDYIVGADLFFKKELLLQTLNLLKEYIIFAEDYSMIYLMCIGEYPLFINSNFVFYEYGTGISTNANSNWIKRLNNDQLNLFNFLLDEKLINRNIYNTVFPKNRIISLLRKTFYNSRYMILRIFHKSNKVEFDINKLLDIYKI